LLVGLCFAGGYAARSLSARGELASAGLSQRGPVSAPGTSVASAKLETGANIDLRPLETMLMVLKHLREHYVEQLSGADEGKMTHDSLRSMLASLNDPNTRFLDPAQRKLIDDAVEGKFHGIGAVLGIKSIKSGNLTEEHLIVVAPLEGGPAARAGLRPGDDIIEVDGKNVLPFDPYQRATALVSEWSKRKLDQSEVRKRLKVEQKRIEDGMAIFDAERLLTADPAERDKDAGRKVELTLVREGSTTPIKVKLERQTFSVAPVTSSLLEGDTVGYAKISCLSRSTGAELESALAELRSRNVRSLVLDLRNLAGGEVDTTAEVAKPFLAGKRALGIEVRSRNRRSVIAIPQAAEADRWKTPIVVLVNAGTARMGELLAAALRENRGARLVGERTYGDFAETTLIDQRDGSAVLLTTGALLTSKGGNYSGKGLPVDVTVASTAQGDAQLKEAVRLAATGGRG